MLPIFGFECVCRYPVNNSEWTVQIATTVDGTVPEGVPPYTKNGGWGCPTEILKRISKRYQHPALWAWFEIFVSPKK